MLTGAMDPTTEIQLLTAAAQVTVTLVLVVVTIGYAVSTHRIAVETQQSREVAERRERYSRLPILWCEGQMAPRRPRTGNQGTHVDAEIRRIGNVGAGTALNVQLWAIVRNSGARSHRGVSPLPLQPGDIREASIILDELFDPDDEHYGTNYAFECIYLDVAGERYSAITEETWGRIIVREVTEIDPEGNVTYGVTLIDTTEIDVTGGAPYPALPETD